MSALHGLAHLGTMDSTDYLLQQVRSSNIDHALMALGRVSSRQGVEMTRAAAAGSRGFEGLEAGVRQALLRSAAAAEGQLARLREEGCDEVQGYLFSRPVCAEDFEKLLRGDAGARTAA
jgi:predicted signal transduction protein with EAL and GGDEF domain